jgi:hypothetical protein
MLLFLCGLLLTSLTAQIYDANQALINVWLSGAAYCDKNTYPFLIVSGPARGFVYKYTLYDKSTDLQGIVGIIPQEKNIYVSFRGTSSITNWMSDLEVMKVPYTTFSDCKGCMIHKGFYLSVQNIKNQTLLAINQLRAKYPYYGLTLTGHSYGAIVAQIMGMELASIGINADIYNYGQPRGGNNKYADFVNTKLKNYWRFTHDRDIVPHLPPITEFDYYHSCGEVFEDSENKLHICSQTNCEDPKCADKYSTSQTTVNDHYFYLNHRVNCSESTTSPQMPLSKLFHAIF